MSILEDIESLERHAENKPTTTISAVVEFLCGDMYWLADNIAEFDKEQLRTLIKYIDKEK